MDLVEVAYQIVRESKSQPSEFTAQFGPAMVSAAEIFLVTQFENQIEAQKIQLDTVRRAAGKPSLA
jgi:hypothetical protein